MKKYNQSAAAFIIFCIIILLIVFSKEAKSGAIEGINLCEGIIIPSLLPILILCNTLVKLTSKGKTPKAVLFGMISGYPSGAVLTRELYKSNTISPKQAEWLMSFNFCGGAGFIISALGTVVLKSTKAGILLYLCSVLSSLITAILTKPFYKGDKQTDIKAQKTSLTTALCDSVESSVKSLALMSAYIIVFSALLSIANIPSFLVPLLEITNGICNAKTLPPLPLCAFFLSFGGLCIHFQLFPLLKEMKVKYRRFFFFRIFSAVLSYYICKAFLLFFPDISLASASLSPSLPFEISKLGAGLSTVMIIGCAVVAFDIENRKIGVRG